MNDSCFWHWLSVEIENRVPDHVSIMSYLRTVWQKKTKLVHCHVKGSESFVLERINKIQRIRHGVTKMNRKSLKKIFRFTGEENCSLKRRSHSPISNTLVFLEWFGSTKKRFSVNWRESPSRDTNPLYTKGKVTKTKPLPSLSGTSHLTQATCLNKTVVHDSGKNPGVGYGLRIDYGYTLSWPSLLLLV